VLEDRFFGKSWKIKLKVLKSPGKISLKVAHFFIGSNGSHFFCSRLLVVLTFKFVVPLRYISTFMGYEKVLENCSWGSWKVLEKSWIFCQ